MLFFISLCKDIFSEEVCVVSFMILAYCAISIPKYIIPYHALAHIYIYTYLGVDMFSKLSFIV